MAKLSGFLRIPQFQGVDAAQLKSICDSVIIVAHKAIEKAEENIKVMLTLRNVCFRRPLDAPKIALQDR